MNRSALPIGRAERGFTLVELMVTLAILAALLAIAVPSYSRFILRANRSEAVAQLNRVALEQERFLYRYGRYATSIDAAVTLVPATSGLGFPATTRTDAADDQYYDLTLTTTPDWLGYELAAVPMGRQAQDECGTLTLSHVGERGAEVSGCW